jgi:exodeoxyribonuclease-5
MQSFLDNSEHFFLLKGYAGCGKTFCISALIHQLQEQNNRLSIAASAPTHKAVKVLKGMSNKWGKHNVDYATIYQLLGLKLEYDDEGGRVLNEGRGSAIGKYELIILDEASMVSTKLWALLSEVVPSRDVKVICMGDPAQLPPVNEPSSPVFSAIANSVELTEVMRHKTNNPIADLIEAAREKVFDSDRPLVLDRAYTPDQQSGVWVLERASWLNQMIRAFSSPKYKENPDYVRAIAWTNKAVDALNNYIRQAIYEDADRPYVIGERLVAKDTIFDPVDGEEIIMPTSSECQVISAKAGTDNNYQIWRLKVVDDEGDRHYLRVLDRSSMEKFNVDLKELAHKAKQKKLAGAKKPWQEYWELRNRYAQFNYAYAITSHKSQGSTFSNVFVAQKDICRNPNDVERYKSLYVSYSRASDRLIINI